MTKISSNIQHRVLKGFDDPYISPQSWNNLLHQGQSNFVFMTWEWQHAWWSTFRRDQLLLIAIELDGQLIAIAPFFTDSGMVFFVGAENSAYLDFIEDVSNPDVIDAILLIAMDLCTGFLGFQFHQVPDSSQTSSYLKGATERLGLSCFDEWDLMAPMLDLTVSSTVGLEAAKKKSLVRHDKYFQRDGLIVKHFTDGEKITPHLKEFFIQHIRRRAETSNPSSFNNPTEQLFYQNLTAIAADTGWLHFTRLEWHGRPIAFHFGLFYRGRFMWYKPSFDIELAKHSPVEVLIRHLLLKMIENKAEIFDFGTGDNPFKHRFANKTPYVHAWGLYPQKISQ